MNVFRKAINQMVFSLTRFGRRFFGTDGGMRIFPNSRRKYADKVVFSAANVVMAPVLWIARAFPQAPLRVMGEDGWIDDHDMLELLRHPNEHYGGRLMWMALIISLLLDGNAYIVKIKNGTGRPVELWYVPYWMIEPASESETAFIEYYRYTPAGEAIRLEPDDVVHIRYGIDPENPRKGLPPLRSAVREVFTDDEGANFVASILENGGVPGVIIAPDTDSGNIPPQDLELTRDYLSKQFSGDNRGKPLALSAPTKVQEFGWDPSKINLSAVRNVSEERVCALLGAPAAVVGFGTGVQQTKVGATLKELRASAWEDMLIPMQQMVAGEIHSQLLPEFEPNPENLQVVFDTSEVRALQEDETERIKRINLAIQGGWLTVARGQQLAGYEVDDTQDVYLRASMTVETPGGITGDPPAAQRSGSVELKRLTEEEISQAETFNARQLESLDRLRRKAEAELVERFDEYGRRAMELWIARSEQTQLNTMGAQTKAAEDAEIVNRVVDELSGEMSREEVLAYGAMYVRAAEATVENLNSVLGAGVNLTDEFQSAMIDAASRREVLIDLAGQTRAELFDAIEQAREIGEGPDALARRIRSRVGAGPWKDAKTRAEVIARTETKLAQNMSSVQAGKQAEATAYRVFDAQLGDTDSFCMSVNGMVISPADADIAAASEHPNGTRSLAPLFGDHAEDIERFPMET